MLIKCTKCGYGRRPGKLCKVCHAEIVQRYQASPKGQAALRRAQRNYIKSGKAAEYKRQWRAERKRRKEECPI